MRVVRRPRPAGARRLFCAAALVAVTLLPAARARACAACGCGDPTLTAMGVEKPYENRVRLALEERFGGLTLGSGADAEHAWTLRSAVAASWSPTGRLTIALMVPLISNWVATGDGAYQNLTGLGDVELSARWVLWRDRNFSPRHLVSILGGIKTPTGPELLDPQRQPYDADAQPGSGSWDPFAGLAWQWFDGKWSTFSSLSYRYTTVGREEYRRGQSLGGTAGVQLQPLGRVAFSVQADVLWQAPDELALVTVDNTGGTMVALTPAVSIAPAEDWLIRAAYQVHVAEWNHGVQDHSNMFLISTVYDFN